MAQIGESYWRLTTPLLEGFAAGYETAHHRHCRADPPAAVAAQVEDGASCIAHSRPEQLIELLLGGVAELEDAQVQDVLGERV